MTRNPSLVPTAVVDKNGKRTTVYRKPEHASGQSSSFPKPPTITQAATPPAGELAQGALIRLVKCGASKDSNEAYGNLVAIAEEDPELLVDLVAHIERANENEKKTWYNNFYTSISQKDDHPEGISEHYRRHLATRTLAVQIAEHDMKYPVTFASDNYFIDAEYLVKDDLGEDYKRLKAAVIVSGIQSLIASETNKATPRREYVRSDTDFIAENFDAVERVVNELVSRRTTDPEVIRELLRAPIALAEGSL